MTIKYKYQKSKTDSHQLSLKLDKETYLKLINNSERGYRSKLIIDAINHYIDNELTR